MTDCHCGYGSRCRARQCQVERYTSLYNNILYSNNLIYGQFKECAWKWLLKLNWNSSEKWLQMIFDRANNGAGQSGLMHPLNSRIKQLKPWERFEHFYSNISKCFIEEIHMRNRFKNWFRCRSNEIRKKGSIRSNGAMKLSAAWPGLVWSGLVYLTPS